MDAGPIDGRRMSRSQAKSKKKAKGRPPPHAAQPEDEDELGNAVWHLLALTQMSMTASSTLRSRIPLI